ncbi:MAG: DUF2235 domain-containing protein [Paracoccaceae bacterium]
MVNLIVCCDGTWNTRSQKDGSRPSPTNVVKLHAILAEKDQRGDVQKSYYREGVGTSGGAIKRALGGAIGLDLENDIESAYKWLAETYTAGDNIFLFGFSRGAYTVRSLAGLMASQGLLDFSEPTLTERDKWAEVKKALRRYQTGKRQVSANGLASQEVPEFVLRRWFSPDKTPSVGTRHGVPIHFLGVWDTVGALGIPDDLGLTKLVLGNLLGHKFHDTALGPSVRTACHAVAIDEMRLDFTPTLWTKSAPSTTLKQVWFTGVHGDVGGSYGDDGLGDITLRWMLDEANAKGMAIRPGAVNQLSEDHRSILHDSVAGVFANRPTRPRSVPPLKLKANNALPDDIHSKVIDRVNSPALIERNYWPTKTLDVWEEETVRIHARDHWSRTGLYLFAGQTYDMNAEGEWLDSSIRCGPDGSGREGGFSRTLRAGGSAPFELYRGLLRKLPTGEHANNGFSRRDPDQPWFTLMGVVAGGSGVNNQQNLVPHETIRIGLYKPDFTPKQSGYLYAYPNDAWRFYGNNAGSVALTVKRTN